MQADSSKPSSNYRFWVLGAICILTFICFSNSLHNQFSIWDDDVYVTNDTTIRALNAANLKTIFTEDITKNNYHPFCMLSLALNYQFAKLSPPTYYLTNILIHLANIVLVFFFITKLCERLKLKDTDSFLIASFAALWFGIHPLHVESVSWIAERKDVLYTFFYLLGLLAYIKQWSVVSGQWSVVNRQQSVANPPFTIHHLQFTIKNKWYWYTFLLFVASCLSKPMAVVFPLSLIALDFFYGRIATKKDFVPILIEKAPFFIASILFGAFAVYTQRRVGAIADFNKLTIMERIMYACYGFDMYLYKLINPTFLSTFYPYPYRYISGYLPFIYYAAPFIAILIVALPVYITYKRNRTYFSVVVFSYGFFIVNVIFVLQFISCGAAIMADRYSYVSSIGILFGAAYFINELIKRVPSLKMGIITLLLILSSCLSYICYQRTKVWHDSISLLTDAVSKYPFRALLSYKWLGKAYLENGDTDKAVENYGILAQLNAGDAKVYDELGNIYLGRRDYKDAMTLYEKSLREQGNVYITYVDRSLAYAAAGDSANAIRDYAQALRLSPEAEKLYSDRSFNMEQSQKFKEAISQYSVLILLHPNNPYYYFYRGVAKFSINQMNSSISDFKAAVKFNSPLVSPSAAFNLAIACDSVGDIPGAIEYGNIATQMGAPPKPGFMEKLKMKEERLKGKR